MPCTISINSILGNPTSATTTDVLIQGSVSGCTSNQVNVSITCGGQLVTGIANVVSNDWSITLSTKCLCNASVTVSVSCTNDPTCAASLTENLNCDCCPIIVNIDPNYGLCDANHQRYVSFVATVTVKPQCTSTFQLDYGDGNLSAQVTLGSGSHGLTFNHYYATGVAYTATLNVIQPTPCAAQTVNVDVLDCPDCNTIPAVALLCRILQPLFVFCIAFASAIFIANFACLVPPVVGIAVGMYIAAGVFLIVLFFVCRDCICAFFVKLLGQALVATGIVLIIFSIPPNCSSFVPLFFAVLAAFLVGAGLLTLYQGWYLIFSAECPLRLCNYWLAVFYSAAIGIVAALFVFTTIFTFIPLGANPLGLATAILMGLGLMSVANMQIQSLPNCP